MLSTGFLPEILRCFETGVRYQMYHTFAILVVAGRSKDRGRLWLSCRWFFLAGISFFRKSLCAHADGNRNAGRSLLSRLLF